MKNTINRICIIGGSGSGKTTLADNLGNKLGLPTYHIDGINYYKNWEQRDKAERDEIILEKNFPNKKYFELIHIYLINNGRRTKDNSF